jgi:hypothetical protein
LPFFCVLCVMEITEEEPQKKPAGCGMGFLFPFGVSSFGRRRGGGTGHFCFST